MTDHFLLTRFNLKKSDWQQDKNCQKVLDEKWLKNRIGLFTKYCLPSVLGQTRRDFKWLIFFQEAPEPEIRKLLKKLEVHDFIEPVFVNGFEEFQKNLPLYIAKRMTAGSVGLLTTRLDNDDALHKDFIRWVQDATIPQGRDTVLHFPKGLFLDLGDQKRLGASTYPLNQFISLKEAFREDAPLTALGRAHDSWGETLHIQALPHTDAWLQITHSHNMINRFKGVPVFSSRLNSFCIEKVNFKWDYDLRLLLSGFKIRLKRFIG